MHKSVSSCKSQNWEDYWIERFLYLAREKDEYKQAYSSDGSSSRQQEVPSLEEDREKSPKGQLFDTVQQYERQDQAGPSRQDGVSDKTPSFSQDHQQQQGVGSSSQAELDLELRLGPSQNRT
jgi:hypothetical protein